MCLLNPPWKTIPFMDCIGLPINVNTYKRKTIAFAHGTNLLKIYKNLRLFKRKPMVEKQEKFSKKTTGSNHLQLLKNRMERFLFGFWKFFLLKIIVYIYSINSNNNLWWSMNIDVSMYTFQSSAPKTLIRIRCTLKLNWYSILEKCLVTWFFKIIYKVHFVIMYLCMKFHSNIIYFQLRLKKLSIT